MVVLQNNILISPELDKVICRKTKPTSNYLTFTTYIITQAIANTLSSPFRVLEILFQIQKEPISSKSASLRTVEGRPVGLYWFNFSY